MTFEDVVQKALAVQAKYDALNKDRGKPWDGQDLMAGFVGDVGDLSKIIMAKEGLRPMDQIDALAHELADCLWSVVVIADKYDVDLAAAFQRTMSELEARIERELGDGSSPVVSAPAAAC